MKEELSKFGILEEHASLKDLNTYKIDASTRYLLHPRNVQELISFVKYANLNNLCYFVLGNGSNIVLCDGEYPSVIVKLDELKQVFYDGCFVTCEAGVMINKLGYEIVNHGLKGLEWATGIPGSIGGCIYGNAGAYNESTFDSLVSVSFVDSEGNLKELKKEEIFHGYRTTAFKEGLKGIIVSGLFKFEEGDKDESLALILDRLNRRLSSQPLEYPNAGSVFRNPSKELPSGKLIDDLGLKGFSIHDAVISSKHANFIVNMGQATGKDIRTLIQLVHDKVLSTYHIDLVLEQEFIDWGNEDEEKEGRSKKD